MWSYVKVPNVPGEDSSGIVCLEKYCVSEGDEVKRGDRIAVAHTDRVSFAIVSNYEGKILKIILGENYMVGFRDAIATLELMEDPVDGRLIERCEIVEK